MSSLLGAFDYYTVRSNDVKVLKSRWNFVKTKITTPGNNIYTLVITFTALFRLFHLSFISHTNSHITLGPPVVCRQRSSSNQLSAASVLIQQNQHGDMASFAEASYKAPTKSERNLFFFVRVDFLILIQSSARTHVRMAVLIRCITCFIFGDQEKFLAAKFTFQHFDLVSFTAERLFFSELRPSH